MIESLAHWDQQTLQDAEQVVGVRNLLAVLKSRGIEVQVVRGALWLTIPRGVLTPALAAEIVTRRRALHDLLVSEAGPS